jgi:Flp pilus assembly pilin Flp
MRSLTIKAYTWLQARHNREEGQTVIEYALVVALVSVVLILALVTFGTEIIVDAKNAVADAFTGDSVE